MTTLLPPYYHPTTICFIDDNASFLRAMSIDLPDDYLYISFLHADEAIAAINTPDPLPPLVDRCFTLDNSDPSAPIIRLDLSVLENEIKLIERFRRLSVLMIDYAMPVFDGLEFCAEIKDKTLKKALLTGVAEEKTAVAAFNQGLIDSYIPKRLITDGNKIIPYADALKKAYFDQYSARLSSNLALNPPRFMTDKQVADYFYAVLKAERIVEYYLVSEPYGYLMLRANGSMLRLVFFTEDQRSEQLALAQAHQAPAHIMQQLSSGQSIAFLNERPEDYLGFEPYPWDEVMLPATVIRGEQNWYAGIAENPPADIDFNPQASSYERYLAQRKPRR
ncbi:MAG: hypothetical protein ACFHXK_04445 [bacterium]